MVLSLHRAIPTSTSNIRILTYILCILIIIRGRSRSNLHLNQGIFTDFQFKETNTDLSD